MNTSACQNKGISCGACCGIFNLKLSGEERRSLVQERGVQFAGVDLRVPYEIAGYRRARETAEAKIERGNVEIYVCPFYGPITIDGRSVTGCMIHPSLTGNPHSQNFSFYGTSICQAYDCPPKDKDTQRRWSSYLRSSFPASDEYARLMADSLFYDALDRAGLFACFSGGVFVPGLALLVGELCAWRLRTVASHHITSFELKMINFPSLEDELFYLLELGEKNVASEKEIQSASTLIRGLLALIRAHQDSPRNSTEERRTENPVGTP